MTDNPLEHLANDYQEMRENNVPGTAISQPDRTALIAAVTTVQKTYDRPIAMPSAQIMQKQWVD